MTLPEEIPAMSLPGIVLLPKTVMPLRIFEERYRTMLADSLSEDRMFAIVNLAPLSNDAPYPNAGPRQGIATVGLIRMSSQKPDGTSVLVLEGTERVRIVAVSHRKPYPILRIAKLPTTNRPQDELEAELVVDLLDKIDELKELLGPSANDASIACHAIDDLEMLAHFIMQTYCTDPAMLQRTLEATNLVERCKIVSDFLQLQITLMNAEEK